MSAAQAIQDEVLALARELISRRSQTPEDAGCQALLADRLTPCGFVARNLPFGKVSNLWLRRGDNRPLLVFAGHTDVVPTGPRSDWRFDPFEPTVSDGQLYGRGAADMKGALAAWVVACESFLADTPSHRGSLALLITSDEEGAARDGTRRVVEWLERDGQRMDWCVVGESSSKDRLGDTLRVGRRGSLGGEVTVYGRQGHVAYPESAENPIHRLAPALAELAAEQWDSGNAHFPPTGFQVSNVNSGTGADNVIPGEARFLFNFRYSTESTAESLKARFCEILDRHGLRYTVEWHHSGDPFLTARGELLQAVQESLREIAGIDPVLDTGGGTSDGRFIAPTGTQVIELGPLNATIHQVNEHVSVEDLGTLSRIYRRIIEKLTGRQ